MNDIFSLFKSGLSDKIKDGGEEKSSSYNIFFISCFLDNLWTHDINLCSNNKEMKINNLFEKIYYFENKKYRAVIHKINIINSKQLNLYIISQDNHIWNLNEIEIQEKRVIFDNLEINPRYYAHLFNEFLHENDNKTKISFNLQDIEKLRFFIDFFINVYIEFLNNNNNFDKIVQDNLVEKFIDITQNQKEFDFLFLIKIFIIFLGTEKINNFFDIFETLNIKLNDKNENNIFNYFLDIYKQNKNLQYEKWSRSLDKFITIYQLLYEEPSKIEKQKLIEVKPIIINLINNKKDINIKLHFIISIYKSLYTLLTAEKKELFDVSYEALPSFFDLNIFYNSFYLLLLKKEEEYGIILNLSKFSDYFFKQFLNKNKIVKYSDILEIFNLSFGTEKILFFLENFAKLNYILDSEIKNKKFNTFLNLYKNHKETFLKKNQKYFEVQKKKKIKKRKI